MLEHNYYTPQLVNPRDYDILNKTAVFFYISDPPCYVTIKESYIGVI